MSLIPRPLSEWFRHLRQRVFMAAMGVTAEEAAADLEAESLAAKKRRVATAMEALDFARQLETEDEDKAAILAAFKADLLEARSISASVLAGRIPLEEGLEDLRTRPTDSGGSATSLPDGSRTEVSEADRPETSAEMLQGEATPSEMASSEPQRRGRGRPPGSRNRPKFEQGNENEFSASPEAL